MRLYLASFIYVKQNIILEYTGHMIIVSDGDIVIFYPERERVVFRGFAHDNKKFGALIVHWTKQLRIGLKDNSFKMLYLNFIKKGNIRDKKISHKNFL